MTGISSLRHEGRPYPYRNADVTGHSDASGGFLGGRVQCRDAHTTLCHSRLEFRAKPQKYVFLSARPDNRAGLKAVSAVWGFYKGGLLSFYINDVAYIRLIALSSGRG